MGDDLMRALGQRQRTDPLESERVSAELLEAANQLDEDEDYALIDDMFRRLDAGELADGADESIDEEDAGPSVAVPVTSLSDRRRSRAVAVAVVVATLAAALLLWLVVRPATSEVAQIADLPEYVVTKLHGGDAKMRAPPQAPPSAIEVAPGERVELIVAPRSPVRPPLAVVVLAVGPDGDARLVVPAEPPVVSVEGVVQLKAPVESLGATAPGTWELQLLIGPPATLPQAAEAAEAQGPWARVTLQVTVSLEASHVTAAE